MPDELSELWDIAIYKEIAAQAVYLAAQSKTPDPGAKALLEELADAEQRHAQLLKKLKERGWQKREWHPEKLPNLMISEYLTGPDTLEGAGLEETLVFALKREQQSIDFYSRMISLLRDEAAKHLCERLIHEELKHKLRLELFYDELFQGED